MQLVLLLSPSINICCLQIHKWQFRLQVMSKHYDELTQLLGQPEEVEVAFDPELGPLSEWREVFMTCEVS